jgi:hypothetical protein
LANAEGFHLIRIIAFGGASKPFLSRLAREKGVWSFFYSGSRRAVGDHTRTRGRVTQFIENEEIHILVPSGRLNELMEFAWVQLGMDKPGRGVIYATPTDMAALAAVPTDMADNYAPAEAGF